MRVGQDAQQGYPYSIGQRVSLKFVFPVQYRVAIHAMAVVDCFRAGASHAGRIFLMLHHPLVRTSACAGVLFFGSTVRLRAGRNSDAVRLLGLTQYVKRVLNIGRGQHVPSIIVYGRRDHGQGVRYC